MEPRQWSEDQRTEYLEIGSWCRHDDTMICQAATIFLPLSFGSVAGAFQFPAARFGLFFFSLALYVFWLLLSVRLSWFSAMRLERARDRLGPLEEPRLPGELSDNDVERVLSWRLNSHHARKGIGQVSPSPFSDPGRAGQCNPLLNYTGKCQAHGPPTPAPTLRGAAGPYSGGDGILLGQGSLGGPTPALHRTANALT